jgi:hypothetical protein
MGPVTQAKGGFTSKMNRDFLWPPSIRASALVSGAGTAAVNGQYDYDGAKWVKGAIVIDLSPNWSLHSGATIYYTAPVTEFPWDVSAWTVGAGGAAPGPVVLDNAI